MSHQDPAPRAISNTPAGILSFLWVSGLITTLISLPLGKLCYTKARCTSYWIIAPFAFHRKYCAESSCTLYIRYADTKLKYKWTA